MLFLCKNWSITVLFAIAFEFLYCVHLDKLIQVQLDKRSVSYTVSTFTMLVNVDTV